MFAPHGKRARRRRLPCCPRSHRCNRPRHRPSLSANPLAVRHTQSPSSPCLPRAMSSPVELPYLQRMCITTTVCHQPTRIITLYTYICLYKRTYKCPNMPCCCHLLWPAMPRCATGTARTCCARCPESGMESPNPPPRATIATTHAQSYVGIISSESPTRPYYSHLKTCPGLCYRSLAVFALLSSQGHGTAVHSPSTEPISQPDYAGKWRSPSTEMGTVSMALPTGRTPPMRRDPFLRPGSGADSTKDALPICPLSP